MIIAQSPLRMGYITARFAFDSGSSPSISPPNALANDEAVWNGTTFVARQRSSVRVASTQTFNSTNYFDVNALTVPINRVGVYSFEYYLLYSSNAITEGAGFQVAYTGTAAGVDYALNMFIDATNQAPISVRSSFAGGQPPQSAGPSSIPAIAYITGSFNATSVGDLSVQVRAESGGANSVSVNNGSWARVYAQ